MIIKINSVQKMQDLGARIGESLKGGECIELIGDIGTGKTTLTKGIATGMGIRETVQSPTFTISRVYEGKTGIKLAHYDFYRLSEPGIMADELAEVSQDPQASIVIEWGDIVQDVLPKDRLTLRIMSTNENSRSVNMIAHGGSAQRLLEKAAYVSTT